MEIDWKKYETKVSTKQDINWDKYSHPVSKDIDWQKYEQPQPVSTPEISQSVNQPISIPETLAKLATLPAEPIRQFINDPARLIRSIPETVSGKSASQYTKDLPLLKHRPEQFTPAFLRGAARMAVGDVADMATTPISYALPGATELALMSRPVQMALRKYLPNITRKFLNRPITASEKAYQSWLKNPKVSPTPKGLIAEQLPNPVQTITKALKEAQPIRSQQELLYQAERAKRAGEIIEAGQSVPGEQGYFAQLKALKGELPKVQFKGIRGKVSQNDIDSLFNMVEQHQVLSPYEKISAKTGLIKLLGAKGGSVPTEGELKLLSQVFPPDFVKTILAKRPLTQKLFEGTAEVLNVPRALMASADMSAPLRQGLFLINRPKQWLPAFRDMFKYAFNEKSYQGLMTDIQKRPTFQLMKDGGLSLTDMASGLTGREERFMSNLAGKIPVLGHIVRGSNRAYTGFLNKLRADTFDDMVNSAQKLGLKPEGKLLTDIGNFISTATGRGKLPGALERSAVTLNSVFFSPRLMASRINLLNPIYYTKLDPFVRKEALKSLLTLTGTATSIITLAKMGGAEVGTDPRSADFGKIKYGNTRYDILGGFQQYIRLASQFITGEHISSTTGVKTTVGEGYKPLTRTDILGRFLETKEAPVVTFALGLLRGQNNLGKEFNIPQEIGQRFVPMVAQDMYDLAKERGLEGVVMAVPGIFGVGLQTYSPTPTEIVYSSKSVIKHTKDLLAEGRKEEAKKLYLRNEKLMTMGEKLEPLQKELSRVEKAKEFIKKSTEFTPEQKKKGLTYTEMMIKKYGQKMLEKYKEIK